MILCYKSIKTIAFYLRLVFKQYFKVIWHQFILLNYNACTSFHQIKSEKENKIKISFEWQQTVIIIFKVEQLKLIF